jgi:tripartite-type tricarboxylate transporter receptor subunit TctC
VATPRRIPQMPDVPTLAEAGGPAGFELNSFVVLVAPKGIPAALVTRVDADVARVLTDPDVKTQLDTFAFERLGWTRADILKNTDAKSLEYRDLVARGGISLD